MILGQTGKPQGVFAGIKREVTVGRKLVSCLNVAKLEDVYEDAAYVHIITEWCKGGELDHSVGDRHYSERTVRRPPSPHVPSMLPPSADCVTLAAPLLPYAAHTLFNTCYDNLC